MTRPRPLTDARCRAAAAAPKGKRAHLWDHTDTPHLALRTTDTGRKSWIVRRRLGTGGLKIRVTIGAYPDLGLAKARALARPIIEQLAAGINPLTVRKEEREGTFGRAWPKFFAAVVKGQRSAAKVERIYKRDLAQWDAKAMADLRRADVIKLLDQIVERGAATQAQRVLEHLKNFFKWYADRDERFIVPVSPTLRMAKKQSRSRVLTDAEVRALWAVTDTFQPTAYASLVRILLLSGQRLSDWLRATDDELREDVLVIPGARYKTKQEHRVPVVSAIHAELARVPRIVGGKFLFARRADAPFGGLCRAKQRLDIAMREQLNGALPEWRLHDLRRTWRTLAAPAGVSRDIAERVMGHRVGGAVERTYDHWDYAEARRDALEKMAAMIRRIVAGASREARVIQLFQQNAA